MPEENKHWDCLREGPDPPHFRPAGANASQESQRRARQALVRRHAVALVSALVPVARAGGAASAEALSLLRYVATPLVDT